MRIEIDDEIAAKCGIDEEEALRLLAVAIYRAKGIHSSLAGKILGISQIEFHRLLASLGESMNYDVQDLIDDIKDNDL